MKPCFTLGVYHLQQNATISSREIPFEVSLFHLNEVLFVSHLT